MPFVPPIITGDDIYRVTFAGTLAAQRILWVLHYRFTTIVDNEYLGGLEDMVNALATDMQSDAGKFGAIRVQQSSDLMWDWVQIQRIVPTRDIYFRAEISTAGGTVSEAAPPNVALSVTNRTAFADRHGVGRNQLAGFPLTKIEDGLWLADFVDTIQALVGAALIPRFEESGVGNEMQAGVFAVYAVTTEINDIIDVVGHDQVRTMHRRTVGLGI